ncbi:hypothetical protein ACPV5L_14460 [Vibrio astriarenae]
MRAVYMGLTAALSLAAHDTQAQDPYYLGYIDSSTPPAWGQIDKTGITFLPNDDLYPVFLPNDIMTRYQEGQALVSDVRWTFEAIYQMYQTEWEAQPNIDTEQGRQAALAYLLDDVACEALPEEEPLSNFSSTNTEGSVLNLELDTCIQDEKTATYRLRTFVPTVPGATYSYEVKYRQVKPSSNSDDGYHGGWYHLLKKMKSHWYKFSWGHWSKSQYSYSGWMFKGWDDDDDHYSKKKKGKGYGHCKHEHKHHGHKYSFFRHHHWHHSEHCNQDNEVAAPNLFLRISGNLNYLPTAEQSGDVIEDGFITKSFIYTADDFYTPIYISKDGVIGSNKVLLRSFVATEVASNSREESCLSYYPENSAGAKNCLIGETPPEQLGCDLSEAALTWREGTLDPADIGVFNTTKENVFSTTDDQYLALGVGGDFVIGIRDNGYRAACPVEGKTLVIEERGTSSDVEVGLVKIRFAFCDNEALNGVYTLLSNQSNMDAQTFTNGQTFSHTFGTGFEGCAVEDIRIQDGRGIYGVGAVDPYDDTGIDIFRLSLD